MIKCNHKKAIEQIQKRIKSGETGILYTIADNNFICVGKDMVVDESMRDGYEVINSQHEGGLIVEQTGDIDILIFTRGYQGHQIKDDIFNTLGQILSKAGLNYIIFGNDMMVEDKKCASYGSRMYGDTLYTAVHISMSVDLDAIKRICTKPMYKVPGGLCDFGISQNVVYEKLEQLLKDIKL